MSEESVQFHIHPQSTALSTFLPILHPHLPYSNPVYTRIQAPHNIPSRHCLFAATFPSSTAQIPEEYSILFADRSRHSESQIWLFNPLILVPTLTPIQQTTISTHLLATIGFLKAISIPAAPGWPFSPTLRFACLHSHLSSILTSLCAPRQACPYITTWNQWILNTSPSWNPALDATITPPKPLPLDLSVSRVPESQLDIVLSTTEIKREKETLLKLPSLGILNNEGSLVAWAFVGVDGDLATLYVLPKYRGMGLAKFVARELVIRLGNGGYKDIGFGGQSGWVHAGVKQGNEGSEGVMRAIGSTLYGQVAYMWVDSEKF
ncbi:hypothetical protein B7494_g3399 [Chlorociboria aeruginascens]|nr:hypothetical protein B7494_g3399 [Chlorociboria aeruginascens]